MVNFIVEIRMTATPGEGAHITFGTELVAKHALQSNISAVIISLCKVKLNMLVKHTCTSVTASVFCRICLKLFTERRKKNL